MLSDVIEQQRTARMDAEFYQKIYLKNDERIAKKPSSRLVEIVKSIDVGFVGSMTEYYCDDGIPLLQTKNISPFLVQDENTVKITLAFHLKLQKSRVKFEDILIARSGSFGKASIYLKENDINSSDIIIIKAKKECINPYFLTAFLNSSLGSEQMVRFASGGVQGHVNLTILEELRIPVLENYFQMKIEKIIIYAYQTLELSISTYAKAEILLIEKLGLARFFCISNTICIQSFKNSFLKTGRLDAEHYQPKYEQLYKILAANNNLFKLGDHLSFNQRGSQPDYADKGLPVVNSKHVQRGEVNMTDTRFATMPDKANAVVIKKGDVLINGTGVGTIGRAAPYLHASNALPDNHVTVLRTDALSPICLALYLNSIAGQYQVEQYFKGSSGQIELYPADIANFWCPELDESVQNKIDALIEESFTLKSKSKQLLEAAKRAVEIAIEQNEAAAMAYLTALEVLP